MSIYPIRSIRMKKLVLEWAEAHGSVTKACREWDVPRSTFYRWKEAYAKNGDAGLVRKRPIAKSHPRQLSPEVVEKILHLRFTISALSESPGIWSVITLPRLPVQAYIEPLSAMV